MRMVQSGCVAAALLIGSAAGATDLTVEMHRVDADGVGVRVGTIGISENEHGLVLTPDLRKLSPGLLGFHVHQNGSCEPADEDGESKAALSAGDHYDPRSTDQHRGPWGDGHAGDLPALHVTMDGRATHPVLAPRLNVEDVRGRSMVIHAGGDNYADNPEADGGGGARIACGVVDS